MYKWVDEKGTVHYDQLPPKNHSAEKLTNANAASNPTETAAGKVPESKQENAENTPPPPIEDEATRIREENCKIARSNLMLYMRENKVKQPDGAELVLDEEMRATMIKQTEEAIQLYCQ